MDNHQKGETLMTAEERALLAQSLDILESSTSPVELMQAYAVLAGPDPAMARQCLDKVEQCAGDDTGTYRLMAYHCARAGDRDNTLRALEKGAEANDLDCRCLLVGRQPCASRAQGIESVAETAAQAAAAARPDLLALVACRLDGLQDPMPNAPLLRCYLAAEARRTAAEGATPEQTVTAAACRALFLADRPGAMQLLDTLHQQGALPADGYTAGLVQLLRGDPEAARQQWLAAIPGDGRCLAACTALDAGRGLPAARSALYAQNEGAAHRAMGDFIGSQSPADLIRAASLLNQEDPDIAMACLQKAAAWDEDGTAYRVLAEHYRAENMAADCFANYANGDEMGDLDSRAGRALCLLFGYGVAHPAETDRQNGQLLLESAAEKGLAAGRPGYALLLAKLYENGRLLPQSVANQARWLHKGEQALAQLEAGSDPAALVQAAACALIYLGDADRARRCRDAAPEEDSALAQGVDAWLAGSADAAYQRWRQGRMEGEGPCGEAMLSREPFVPPQPEPEPQPQPASTRPQASQPYQPNISPAPPPAPQPQKRCGSPTKWLALAAVAVAAVLMVRGLWVASKDSAPNAKGDGTSVSASQQAELDEQQRQELMLQNWAAAYPENSPQGEGVAEADLIGPGGTYEEGRDLPAGLYRLYGSTGGAGYFNLVPGERIELNDGASLAPADLATAQVQNGLLGHGTFLAGRDFAPGTYRLLSFQTTGMTRGNFTSIDGFYAIFPGDTVGNVKIHKGKGSPLLNVAQVTVEEGQYIYLNTCAMVVDEAAAAALPEMPVRRYDSFPRSLPNGDYILFADGRGEPTFRHWATSESGFESQRDAGKLVDRYYVQKRGLENFELYYCVAVEAELVPPAQPENGRLGTGMYKAGRDLPPGTYTIVFEQSGAFFGVTDQPNAGLKGMREGGLLSQGDESFVTLAEGEYLMLDKAAVLVP